MSSTIPPKAHREKGAIQFSPLPVTSPTHANTIAMQLHLSSEGDTATVHGRYKPLTNRHTKVSSTILSEIHRNNTTPNRRMKAVPPHTTSLQLWGMPDRDSCIAPNGDKISSILTLLIKEYFSQPARSLCMHLLIAAWVRAFTSLDPQAWLLDSCRVRAAMLAGGRGWDH